MTVALEYLGLLDTSMHVASSKLAISGTSTTDCADLVATLTTPIVTRYSTCWQNCHLNASLRRHTAVLRKMCRVKAPDVTNDLLQIGIILSSLGVLSLSAFNFLQIVELLNIIYCLAELMEFAAFIYLRYKAPDLVRYML